VNRLGNQKSEIRSQILKSEIRSQKSEKEIEMASDSVVRSFEDLEVYQRAYRLALELHKLSLKFPRMEQFALADQIRRASKSVCANIAEGFARQRSSSADFHRFIVLAVGSSDEMKVWLSFCSDLGYVAEEDAKRLRDEYSIVARMLHGLRNKWK
jgi:four helix bundle protein